MRELDEVLKTLADGLRSISTGIAAIAGKIEKRAKEAPKPAAAVKKKSAPRKKATAKAPAKKKSPRKAASGKTAKPTATASVLQVISESAGGADMALLRLKTGLTDKQIANALYKLKRQNKVKSEKRGLYTIA